VHSVLSGNRQAGGTSAVGVRGRTAGGRAGHGPTTTLSAGQQAAWAVAGGARAGGLLHRAAGAIRLAETVA